MIETSLANLISNFSPSNLITFLRAKRLRNLSVQNEALSQFNSDKFTNIEKIAFLKFSDVEGLQFFTIKVTKDLTERSGKKAQFDLGKELLNHYDNLYDGIFVFYDSTGNFRFSLIYANYYGTRRKLSNFRRFTFFVSAKLTNKTFIMRMRDGDFSTLDGIKDAFSVEKVTKEFYQDISNWYDWALKTAKFPNDAIVKEKGSEMSVIRLITRMIFIWFMKVKGFISNDFFDETTLRFLIKDFENPEESTYYHAILQNLFFAILSKEVTKRHFRSDPGYKNIRKDYGDPSIFRYRSLFLNDCTYNELFKNIPFLNGGLFTNLDVRKSPENPKEVFIDGFSDNQKNQALVPNKLFFGEDHQIDLNSEYGTKGKHYSVRGLIKTFELFNFTIDENTPDDQDIALDPELLGQVFENLLAKVNPETSEAARKETGSFYTPREIVDFMVDESLVAFFETAVRREIPEAVNLEERLKNLLDYQGGIVQFTKQETTILVQSIDSIKVLDPACGSGAFPMGMLNKLVYILGRLDPTNELWKDLQMTKALQELEKAGKQTDPQERTAREAEIERAFDQRVDSDYGRKLYLIRNAIYGVDIQPMAIQISKLRFFISLIVEQKMDLSVPDRNYGILPLPNLETKFVTANTLVHLYQKPVNIVIKPKVEVTQEVLDWIEDIRNLFRQYIASTSKNYRDGLLTRAIDIGHKVNHKMKSNSDFEALNVPRLFSEGKSQDDFDRYIPPLETQVNIQGDLFQGAIPELKEKLQRIHEQHFTASNETIRDYLEKEDARLRSSLRQQLQEQAALDKNTVRIAGLLSNWDPFDQNSVAGFFDPEWMFDVKDGFDIVIGNPPYISLQEFRKLDPILQETYRNLSYQVHDARGDIYTLFYELGYSLLKWRTGILAFITSNKWMRAGYGKKLRDFFNIHTDPLLLIDFAGQRVFTTATVDVNIMIFRKSKLGSSTKVATIKENCLDILGDYISQNAIPYNFLYGDTWVIMNLVEKNLKEKIESLGTPLLNWNVSINRGIITGYNKAYIITGEVRENLIRRHTSSEKLIRPILRGKDVHRYGYSFKDLWLLFIPWHFPLHEDITIHGCSIKAEEAFKSQYPAVYYYLYQYKDELSSRNTAETGKIYEWYALQRWGSNYWDNFLKQKIIYPNMTKFLPFYLDQEGFFTNQKCFILSGENLGYLTSFFNSEIFMFCFRDKFPELLGGTRELSKIFFETIAVKTVTNETNQFFEAKVLELQRLKKDGKPFHHVEKTIQAHLYEIYELNGEEQQIIQENNKLK